MSALSRGRHGNRLYLARETARSRDEIAPADPHGRDALARFAAALATSSANRLAIDHDGAAPDLLTADRVAAAEHAYHQAAARRDAFEAARSSWLPGRRRQREQLRIAEAVAARHVLDLRRQNDELRHAARPFVTERDLDASYARTVELVVERRLQREHVRELGRGLER